MVPVRGLAPIFCKEPALSDLKEYIKPLPRFDERHVDYAVQFNALSQAVIALQRLVVAQDRRIEELESKSSGASARKTAASK
jgi:hypothetical protein